MISRRPRNLPTSLPSPPPTERIDPTAVCELEALESLAWSEVFRYAPDAIKSAVRLELRSVGPALAGAAAGLDAPTFNRVVGWSGSDVRPGHLDRLVDHYRDLGVDRFMVPVPPSLECELRPALLDRGFRPHNHWMKLWRGPDPAPTVCTSLRAVRLGPDQRDAFAAVLAAAFELPEVLIGLWSGVLGRAGWHHFGIRRAGWLVAVAGLRIERGLAWFGPAATLPEHRGLGAQKLLLARRIETARTAGCRLLTVETAEPTGERAVPSFHNVRKTGFRLACRRPNFVLELPSV